MAQEAAPAKAATDGFWRVWLTIGVLSFGGPAGQIATMHRELVDRRRWIDDAAFLRALNFCMLLPGPEAQQLATWCGWRLGGTRGGLIAGLLFVAPGALVMAALTALYIAYGRLPLVTAAFAGVQAAVVAVVAQAVWRVARRALKGWLAWVLAAAALVAILAADVPFPLVVLAAAAAGWLFSPRPDTVGTVPDTGGWNTALLTALLWLGIWSVPLLLAASLLGPAHPLVDLGLFFARLAAVSFGGAYVGLAYVAQGAAAGHGWVTPAAIVHGLALAETTPGPLVLVYQFVGGIAGQRMGGPGMAAAGMAMVLWVTFAPSFLFVLSLAPQLERLMARPGLAAALTGVTAAVVGVMASLGLWFGSHVLLAGGRPNWFAISVAAAALAMLTRTRIGMIAVLVLAAVAGLARTLT